MKAILSCHFRESTSNGIISFIPIQSLIIRSSCNLQMFRSTIPTCLLVQSQCTLKVLREPYRAPESLNLIFTDGKQDWISAFKETRLAPPFSLKRIKILLISNVPSKAVDCMDKKIREMHNLHEWSQTLFRIRG